MQSKSSTDILGRNAHIIRVVIGVVQLLFLRRERLLMRQLEEDLAVDDAVAPFTVDAKDKTIQADLLIALSEGNMIICVFMKLQEEYALQHRASPGVYRASW